MATVTRNGKTRQVKNLGWLLKHWKTVNSFELYGRDFGHAHMRAFLTDGTVYDCPWASYTHMVEWLNRPVFRGVEIKLV